MDLQFEWDDDKCRRNVTKHGIDFLDVTRAWTGHVLTERSDRKNGISRLE